MKTIEVDFDVYKALTLRRTSEEITENDVLRELLSLAIAKSPAAVYSVNSSAPSDWVTKGVRFLAGTEFRANHKGHTYLGRVEGGALVLNGKRFNTPSAAAMAITDNAVNGWIFWECRVPGKSSWQIIKALRK